MPVLTCASSLTSLLVKLRAQSDCIMATCLYILLSSGQSLSLQTDIQYVPVRVSKCETRQKNQQSRTLKPGCLMGH